MENCSIYPYHIYEKSCVKGKPSFSHHEIDDRYHHDADAQSLHSKHGRIQWNHFPNGYGMGGFAPGLSGNIPLNLDPCFTTHFGFHPRRLRPEGWSPFEEDW